MSRTGRAWWQTDEYVAADYEPDTWPVAPPTKPLAQILEELRQAQRGTASICPECRNGKHFNCDSTAWDDATDAPTACACWARDHNESDVT